jgi:hypothetical protein
MPAAAEGRSDQAAAPAFMPAAAEGRSDQAAAPAFMPAAAEGRSDLCGRQALSRIVVTRAGPGGTSMLGFASVHKIESPLECLWPM